MTNLVACPKCLSTQITAGKRGYNSKSLVKGAAVGLLVPAMGAGVALGGLKGSNQVVCTCLKCGHQWPAGAGAAATTVSAPTDPETYSKTGTAPVLGWETHRKRLSYETAWRQEVRSCSAPSRSVERDKPSATEIAILQPKEQSARPEPQRKSLFIAYILLLTLGVFGAHKFYLRKWFQGFLFLTTVTVAGSMAPRPGEEIEPSLPLLPFLLSGGLVIFVIMDIFLLPSQVRAVNGTTLPTNQRPTPIPTNATTKEVDFEEAIHWVQSMAERGDSHAQRLLACRYEFGHGIPKNCAEAEKWYFRSARQGNADAFFSLGLMAARGAVAPQDFVQAHTFFNLASAIYASTEQSDRDTAAKNRDRAMAFMTPSQVAEAQQAAKEWWDSFHLL